MSPWGRRGHPHTRPAAITGRLLHQSGTLANTTLALCAGAASERAAAARSVLIVRDGAGDPTAPFSPMLFSGFSSRLNSFARPPRRTYTLSGMRGNIHVYRPDMGSSNRRKAGASWRPYR